MYVYATCVCKREREWEYRCGSCVGVFRGFSHSLVYMRRGTNPCVQQVIVFGRHTRSEWKSEWVRESRYSTSLFFSPPRRAREFDSQHPIAYTIFLYSKIARAGAAAQLFIPSSGFSLTLADLWISSTLRRPWKSTCSGFKLLFVSPF